MSRNHNNNNSRSNISAGTSIFTAAVGLVVSLVAVEHAHAREHNRESIVQGVGRWIRESVLDAPRQRPRSSRTAPPRALTAAEVAVLPLRRYSPHNALHTDTPETADDDPSAEHKPFCVVCREPYDIGDTLMRMPCFHEFHAECIRDYLHTTVGPVCPICRHPVSIY
ncbi:E3 ubiquitin ligase BIG BROTHER-related [Gracilariopsis chorda]|uniref:E3 ubiquitin ligase BIG BROTHER-related n=1 Tax=Gracilariopsis chorda TaxID=448386 RepID=A0A2V3IWL7_9FLOR|nr:E3 ubiquitin ligase BIG BROTHER-related [Gracilariopsis chorda]|eukprot:PXF45530.1 E3 ubiquitin ligase BIG BROTHER-related [Gracilariopsis chorda]